MLETGNSGLLDASQDRLRDANITREVNLDDPKIPSSVPQKPLIHSLLYNCLALVIIFTLCLYGLGVVGLYLRWFVLEAPPSDTPTPLIVTVIMPAEPGSEQEPIIITVVATRPPDPNKPATATLEPTPTQWWPPPTATDTPPPVGPGTDITETLPAGEPTATQVIPTVPDEAETATEQPETIGEVPQPTLSPVPPQSRTSATPPF